MAISTPKHYVRLPNSSYTLGNLSLSAVQDEHIDRIRVWRNSQMLVLRQTKEISPGQQRKYFDQFVFSQCASHEPSQILLAIFWEGKFVGYGGLVHINWDMKWGEISFLLNPGITEGSQVYIEIWAMFLKLMDLIAFDELCFKYLYTETYKFRSQHILTLENQGYKPDLSLEEEELGVKSATHSIFHKKIQGSLA